MTEDEAQAWVLAQFGPAAVASLKRFAAVVREEATRQNLVAPATLDTIWSRHIVDSAQLTLLAHSTGKWLDIGTGAGFPGMVVAILRPAPMLLVEPRRLRADFLVRTAVAFGLDHVEVKACKVETVASPCAVISARAVAPVEKLLHAASACATSETRWLLPRGRSGVDDLAEVRKRWAGEFHVEHSATDPASTILVIDHVAARGKRR